jgi:MoxR-like ATPase
MTDDTVDTASLASRVREMHRMLDRIRGEIGRVIVGQQPLVERLLIGLLTRGHILIEGVPGLAKTSAVKALAATVNARFKRIQFTPDLLPADIIGTEVFQPRSGDFTVRKGPLFHNIILADEINRAPSKVQAALLEAMQERQVTIGDQTYPLEEPVLVLATQNPIEQEGTYALPEAQVDRFLMKVVVSYPARGEEKDIVRRAGALQPAIVAAVAERAEIEAATALIDSIHVEESVLDYLVDLVAATRNPAPYDPALAPLVQFGASPRGSICLSLAGRAHAFLEGRSYLTPHDIRSVAPDVLRHRILLTYEAQAENATAEQIIGRLLDRIPVP